MTNILIADDHAFLRAGLEQVLSARGHTIVASVGDGQATIAAVDAHNPDVVVLDLRMPGGGGLAVLEAMRGAGDQRPVVMLAAEVDDASLLAAIRLGVNGIVFKDTDIAVLDQAIATALTGERAIAMPLMERALALACEPARSHPLDTLSERDRRIAECAAQGLRNREIGERLDLSEGAVKVYLHRIYDRLGVSNRTELALIVQSARVAESKGPGIA
ncbi:response regulator [Novosphingobium sp. FSY-8]|uniref:Response regulator n=1 Tax=Novosphingobium ovatum TaxID=1908523 RepID=A0ABW9XF60_9SPHN|nr:response regulator transcription factor [Novosphingobium ovatum]NBC37184.1 response regulator [Novosphingobium ovatum]